MRVAVVVAVVGLVLGGVDARPQHPGPSAGPLLGPAPRFNGLDGLVANTAEEVPAGSAVTASSSGLTVDVGNRGAVKNFWKQVYLASEGKPLGWKGGSSRTCRAGTTGAAHKQATVRRINWFRAMAGVPATVTLDGTFSRKAQAAALIMMANQALTHFPSTLWRCYSKTGAEAAASSNLALGMLGAAAVTGYMQDYGASNGAAGHRRWLLYPQSRRMGTGDVDNDQSSRYGANAIWVFDLANWAKPRPKTRKPYIAWPPPGYVPYPVVWPRWSFSYPGANFSRARVSMKSVRTGKAIKAVKERVDNGAGDNTLVWLAAGRTGNDYGYWPRPKRDEAIAVTVSNVIIGRKSRSFRYVVRIFDPSK